MEGPFGGGYLREDHTGPMLLVAGGSGIAPVKSIAETALAMGMKQPLHLYYGVRDESELYLGPHFLELTRAHANFKFVPVLSHSESTRARRGMVGEAVALDFTALQGFKAYVFGPPPMVRATLQALRARGLAAQDIHADEPAD